MRLLLTLLALLGSTCCQVHDTKQFVVRAGKTDAGGIAISAATLCFSTGDCYSPPKRVPPFALNPTAKAVSSGGDNYVLFTAESYAGGSGSLTLVALLRDLATGTVENLFPLIELSNQSEYQLLNVPEFDSKPVLVIADFQWAPGETHFSRHRYRVKVYMLDDMKGAYVVRVNYVTTKKYPGLDETTNIHVLDAEKPTWTYKTSHWNDKKASR